MLTMTLRKYESNGKDGSDKYYPRRNLRQGKLRDQRQVIGCFGVYHRCR